VSAHTDTRTLWTDCSTCDAIKFCTGERVRRSIRYSGRQLYLDFMAPFTSRLEERDFFLVHCCPWYLRQQSARRWFCCCRLHGTCHSKSPSNPAHTLAMTSFNCHRRKSDAQLRIRARPTHSHLLLSWSEIRPDEFPSLNFNNRNNWIIYYYIASNDEIF